MGRCLGTTPTTKNIVVWNNIAYRVTLKIPRASEGCNFLDTCLNGASKEFISIYTKSRYQWSGFLVETKFGH